jgi:hypothetical protein
MLRKDIRELLTGFDERMKFVQIMQAVTVTSLPDEMKAVFGNDYAMVNQIILMVLLEIKKEDLSDERRCTMNEIVSFLEQIHGIIPYAYDARRLADYIVTTVLQNNGRRREFLTYFNEEEKFENRTLRILDEENGSYTLSDDVFDFLYRSREVGAQLDYSVSRFKLQELLRRDNYSEALEQSRELVEKLRSLALSMDVFIRRCRENLSHIMMDEYETILAKYTDLLENESRQLEELESTVRHKKESMKKALSSGIHSENMQKNLESLQEIQINLHRVIVEQRAVINRKDDFSSSYEAIIQESFRTRNFQHLDFEKDIMQEMRHDEEALLMIPSIFQIQLAKPAFPPMFSIENFYASYRLEEAQEEDAGIELSEEEYEDTLTQTRNERFTAVLRSFFAYASKHGRFSVSEWIQEITFKDLLFLCEENALPNVVLSLYAIGTIDLQAVREDDSLLIPEMNGEFDLLAYLDQVDEKDRAMKEIRIMRTEKITHISLENDNEKRQIELTDFLVEVSK